MKKKAGGSFAVYAAGHSAYGHAQEYLVLTALYDEIQPEIVVWQLTVNGLLFRTFTEDKGFASYGVDSILGVEIVRAINKRYGLSLKAEKL